MIDFVNELLGTLEDELESIVNEHLTSIEENRNAVLTIESFILQLKEKISAYRFTNVTEEIDFFRNGLPLFYSKLIYHLRVYQLETNRSNASNKLYKKLLLNELKDINLFLKKQITFRQYYNSGNHFLDEELFTRGQIELPFLLNDYSLILDTTFCTTYSFILSEMIAFEKLQAYILSELKKPDAKQETTPDIPLNSIIPRKWQLGPFALIEIGYLIYLTGGLQGNLKSTMEFLEQCFDIKLGNYSRAFQEMRIRKNERAIFLSKGIKALYQHMEKLDDNLK